MAEAFCNRLAGGKAKAIYASTQPSEESNPVVARAMLEAEIDISHNKPKLLASEMLDEADRVISMGCINSEACLALLVTTEDWGLLDPERKSLEEVIQIRDEIRGRVSKLLDEV